MCCIRVYLTHLSYTSICALYAYISPTCRIIIHVWTYMCFIWAYVRGKWVSHIHVYVLYTRICTWQVGKSHSRMDVYLFYTRVCMSYKHDSWLSHMHSAVFCIHVYVHYTRICTLYAYMCFIPVYVCIGNTHSFGGFSAPTQSRGTNSQKYSFQLY